MEVITEKLVEKAVRELIEYKKVTDYHWERIRFWLPTVDPLFEDLLQTNPPEYNKLSERIIKKAKEEYDLSGQTRKGVTTKHECWCWPDKLYNEYFWLKFKKMMSGWSSTRWDTVSSQTFDIVNNFLNPQKQLSRDDDGTIKGLVYGNVQSGKTAQIASIISLYASMGCCLTIVFSGATKSLRQQTENRLRNDLGIDRFGTFDLITAETDLLSKKTPSIEGKLYASNCFKPCIGVFKKSPAALKRLLEYLKRTNDIRFWKDRQILIVDDECDQYSPNVKEMYTDDEDSGMNCDRSTINGLLVSIMNVFDRYAYVGFTATPFASILNELPGKDSIYPKDFIYPLEQNKRYYGAQKVFGSVNDNPDRDSHVLNAVRYFKAKDVDVKFNSYKELPEVMKEAVLYFIVGTACKYYRGLEHEHSSCLIHIDLKKCTHSVVTSAMKSYITEIKKYSPDTKECLKNIWAKEKDKIDLEEVRNLFEYNEQELEKYDRPSYEDLEDNVKKVLEKLEVKKDNSDVKMEDRLSYPNDHSVVYIVIGGNTLSRGLTLEGLLVSIFYRNSNLYDTLLQMGRWFGYRIGYEDLARVYTTEMIAFKYSELAAVEENLQAEFNQYNLGTTPEEVATRIRKMPLLQITRKMAMQSAVSTGINYSGSRPSTLFFPHYDKGWHKHNLDVTRKFLNNMPKKWKTKNGKFLYEDIGIEKIKEYVREINIHDANKACNKELILQFLGSSGFVLFK